MQTQGMGHVFTISKYLPAAVTGLVVVAGIVSQFLELSLNYGGDEGTTSLGIASGSIFLVRYESLDGNPNLAPPSVFQLRRLKPVRYSSGDLHHRIIGNSEELYIAYRIPILMPLTLLAPLTFAPFLRFRFPLWSYFAWKALVAAELAYYLR